MLDGVEEGPEEVALEFHCAEGGFLALAGAGVVNGDGEGFLRVARGLGEAAAEVVEAPGLDPGVVLLEGFEAARHEIGSEELGERRGDGDLPGLDADEMEVGIDGEADAGEDVALIEGWLNLLRQQQADHTLAFRALGGLDVQARGPLPPLDVGDMAAVFSDREALASWLRTYQERLQHEPGSADARRERCRRHNPRFILRNHLAQAAIERAERGDFSEVDRLMRVLSAPYDDQPGEDDYARVPPPWARHIEVSCSS